jgi:methionine aminopeptidase
MNEKYGAASRIVNNVMQKLLLTIEPGISVYELCVTGDNLLKDELDNVYKKDDKSIAMPTCISINGIAGYYSPITDDGLKCLSGNLIKVEVGVQIDGYTVFSAKTVHLKDETDKNNDVKANLMKALDYATQLVKSKLRVGNNVDDIQRVLTEVTNKFGVKCVCASDHTVNIRHVPGIISWQISKGNMDSYNDGDDTDHKLIVNDYRTDIYYNTNHPNKSISFENNDVMVIDIALTNGVGELSDIGMQPTIYKKTDIRYNLKMKGSKELYNEFPRCKI